MTSAANPPAKHHFIPAFYLSYWSNAQSKVWQYSRPHQDKPIRDDKHPNATGFERDLYTVVKKGVKTAELESGHLKSLDNNAARALQNIHAYPESFSEDDRISWARFLISLLVRTPASVEALRGSTQKINVGLAAMALSAVRSREGDTSSDRLEKIEKVLHSTDLEAVLVDTLLKATDLDAITQQLCSLTWSVIEFPDGSDLLMTSDRPLLGQLPLNEPLAHLAIPISPSRALIITPDSAVLSIIGNTESSELIHNINLCVISAAERYCYTKYPSDDFVRANFGNKQGSSFGSVLADLLTNFFRQRL